MNIHEYSPGPSKYLEKKDSGTFYQLLWLLRGYSKDINPQSFRFYQQNMKTKHLPRRRHGLPINKPINGYG